MNLALKKQKNKIEKFSESYLSDGSLDSSINKSHFRKELSGLQNFRMTSIQSKAKQGADALRDRTLRQGPRDQVPAFTGPFMSRVVGKQKMDDSFNADHNSVSRDVGTGFYLAGKVKIPQAKKGGGGVPELYYNEKR